MIIPRPMIERMLDRIDATGVCWEWTGATSCGYGVIGRGGRGTGNAYTHRAMWEELVGPIPAGLDIDHRCRNRKCCNPDHLEPVDRVTNVTRGARQPGYRRGISQCPRGHEYDIQLAKQRKCRTCKNEQSRSARAGARS